MIWVGDVHGGVVAAQRAPTRAGSTGGRGGCAHEHQALPGAGAAGASSSWTGAVGGGRDNRGVGAAGGRRCRDGLLELPRACTIHVLSYVFECV
jgi:hypothetical protein